MDKKQPQPIEVTYNEPTLPVPMPDVNIEQIIGFAPKVTAVPTWTPKLFKDHFADYKSGATRRLYVYSYHDNTWRYTALT